VIEFYSDEELDRIYTIISRGTAATPVPSEELSTDSPIAIEPIESAAQSNEVRP